MDSDEKALSKERSLARAKNTAIKLGDFLLAAGATATVGPSGAAGYTLTKMLVTHARKYFAERCEQRTADFFKTLLEGKLSDEEKTAFLDKEIDEATFDGILNSLITDDESKKAPLYANFLRSIIENRLPKKLQYELSLKLRKLAYNDLQLARYFYIRKNFNIKRVAAEHDDPEIRYSGGMLHTHCMSLLNAGLFFLKETHSTSSSAKQFGRRRINLDNDYEGNQYFDSFVAAVFKAEELTPKSMAIPAWSGLKIIILFQDLKKQLQLFTEIEKGLFSLDIETPNTSMIAYKSAMEMSFSGLVSW